MVKGPPGVGWKKFQNYDGNFYLEIPRCPVFSLYFKLKKKSIKKKFGKKNVPKKAAI